MQVTRRKQTNYGIVCLYRVLRPRFRRHAKLPGQTRFCLMVDIHSHILWGMDDGSETYEETLEMLRVAAEAGTTDIVATPHSNSHYEFDPHQIDQKITQLQSSPDVRVRIHRGCDFHLNFINIQAAAADPAKFTINHRNYLLVEFPDLNLPVGTDRVFTQFLSTGIVPVITHPERNSTLMKDIDQLAAWVAQGCLLQVTGLSLTGGFGATAHVNAWELMARGLVHVVASDTHDPVRRSPRLDLACAEVARQSGDANAARLFEHNPRTIIEGQSPALIEPMAEVRRRWYSRWL
jgi:protein-tyrosine phosphatase